MLGGMSGWPGEIVLCKYAGGSGAIDDPYQIATAEDLIALGEDPNDYDKHFILTADIDLDPNLPGGRVFANAIIAPYTASGDLPFAGVFDGNHHTISHLTIAGHWELGLFGNLAVGASVYNLGLEAVDITGTSIRRGTVVVLSGNVGALAGSSRATVVNCYSTGRVLGGTQVGGLVGSNYGDISNCYSSATVSAESSYVGGFVGEHHYGRVRNCYSTGPVTGDEPVGGLIGFNWDTVTRCFWDVETSGQTESAGGQGKTTVEMQMGATFLDAGWDFVGETVNGPNDVWWILEGRDYPRLWWQLPADDFEDGQAEPLWFVYNMTPELGWLEETNGRLEINTTGSAEDVDAIYVCDGWWLDATKPVALQVDFYFGKTGIGDGRLTLGLTPGIEEPVMGWAQFEAGTFDDDPFYLYEVRDGDWVDEQVANRFANSGTLYISYDPDVDELYFSDTAYGQADAIWTVAGLVGDRWQTDSVYVTLGGGSEGMSLTGDDAWFDNFRIDDGTIQQ
jgi:hypothetical protein